MLATITGTVMEVGSDHKNPDKACVILGHEDLTNTKIYLPIEAVREAGAMLYKKVTVNLVMELLEEEVARVPYGGDASDE